MSTQIGLAATTCIVNEYRASRNKPTVSYHCVQTYCKTSDYIKIMKRPVKKSGKDDPLSKWAKARLAQCLQYQKQLARGDEPELAHGTRGASAAAADEFPTSTA